MLSYEVRDDPDGYEGYEQILVRIEAGIEKVIFNDGGEPEDRYLNRDLSLLVDELQRLATKLNELS